MPLIQGSSEESIRANIATLIREGKDPEQAAAIAYSIARENDLMGAGDPGGSGCFGVRFCAACGQPLPAPRPVEIGGDACKRLPT